MIDNFVRRFQVTRVVDGDTLVGTVDLGFHTKWEEVTIRLLGIDTPERGQEGYHEATEYLSSLVQRGKCHLLVTNYDKKTFGRYLGQLTVVDDETQQEININQEMLDKGFAVPFMQ